MTVPVKNNSWRVIDIVTAAVLGVACGLLFWVWNSVGYAGFKALDTLTPGLGGLVTGIWFTGGVLGGLIIRKPGAAVFVEVIAASVSALIGSQWGIETLYSGLAQGLGAGLIFLLFAYRRFDLTVAILAGIGSAVGAFILELFLSANLAMSLQFNIIYLTCMVISGAILGGVLCHYLVKALAKTGALDRFGAGRERFNQAA
ncbi:MULTISPECIES: ECF transporter S component [Corynebacterium]|uniref:ECF transporter S component n=1 Tax=Corynebacterium coyleae TaxID=53374 RepID=A0AAP7CC21_9CORY|nr:MULTISPECIES: ECF transporter S component [Corynebacterium]MDK6493449.1 ECF transporter S component [Corynebacterium coyleae]MDK8241146.1 ECF transporter S component [Corynebacterium coyleae]MDK8664815.1 ECF transporter S component [Corynebacterium coyleae]MDK8707907.1 ECF transporter S component [Corynebacterium coyleae]MDK8734767.1 ECF transporter S component [Corynebacterium coyleae]